MFMLFDEPKLIGFSADIWANLDQSKNFVNFFSAEVPETMRVHILSLFLVV